MSGRGRRASFQIPDRDPNRPKVPEVLVLVSVYYRQPDNGCGGLCHIVLDDGNLDDGSVTYCLERCVAEADKAGAAIMRAMLQMTRSQRRRLYARFPAYGYPWRLSSSSSP